MATVVALGAAFLCASMVTAKPEGAMNNDYIYHCILALTGERNAESRITLARRLEVFSESADLSSIDSRNIDGLASLLLDPEGLVRARIAETLARIGPRAQSALPALQAALARETGVEPLGAPTRASLAIRFAIRRLGGTAPPCAGPPGFCD
jgi:hypothetical protein